MLFKKEKFSQYFFSLVKYIQPWQDFKKQKNRTDTNLLNSTVKY